VTEDNVNHVLVPTAAKRHVSRIDDDDDDDADGDDDDGGGGGGGGSSNGHTRASSENLRGSRACSV